MKNLSTIIITISLLVSCQSSSKKIKEGFLNETLTINYYGDADVVQFKMFEGIHQNLKMDSIKQCFEGRVEIQNLNEAIFTYDIVIQKKDSVGRMLELEPISESVKLNQNKAIEQGSRYLWIGKNRNGNYIKSNQLSGSLITKSISSNFLEGKRELTIYTPKDVQANIPHIYFTDGSNVKTYAPYIDHLISTNRIKPVKLIGIHSSPSNRYEEYVKGINNNERFTKHEKFVFNEVLKTIEKEIENWKGKRYMYGVSNGAAFCMYSGLNHPDLFEEIIAFSIVDYISPLAQIINPINFKFDQYPNFYL
jgi:hypothetical protein